MNFLNIFWESANAVLMLKRKSAHLLWSWKQNESANFSFCLFDIFFCLFDITYIQGVKASKCWAFNGQTFISVQHPTFIYKEAFCMRLVSFMGMGCLVFYTFYWRQYFTFKSVTCGCKRLLTCFTWDLYYISTFRQYAIAGLCGVGVCEYVMVILRFNPVRHTLLNFRSILIDRLYTIILHVIVWAGLVLIMSWAHCPNPAPSCKLRFRTDRLQQKENFFFIFLVEE